MASNTQTNVADEKVIDKIRKLLNMANHAGGNENEKMVAMAKAQELLARYNLDQFSVGDAPEPELVERRYASPISNKDRMGTTWKARLWDAVARANYCRIVLETSYWDKEKRIAIIGRPINVAVVQDITMWLMEQMDKLSREALKECKDQYTNPRAFQRSWYDGCTRRLSDRLHEQRVAREAQEAVKSTALVLHHGQEVQTWMAREYGNSLRQSFRGGSYGGGAQGRGFSDGGKVSLNRELK